MPVLRRTVDGLRTLWSSTAAGFRGFVTIMAFSDSGWKGQLRLSKRMVLFSCAIFLAMAFGSTLMLLNLFRGQYYMTRMNYLEQENRAMTSLLEGQAQQISTLKLEMARLKEFEQSLRQVSGLGPRPDLEEESSSVAATGESKGRRP